MNMSLGKQNLKTSTGFKVNSHNLTFNFDNAPVLWSAWEGENKSDSAPGK